MSSCVLDASILMAIIREERYDQAVLELLPTAVISTVNLVEVLTRAADLDLLRSPEVHYLLGLLERVEPFTLQQATIAAKLRDTTRAGLSLGDRACLALALDLGLPAYTLDRNWLRVDVGCQIYCLR